MAKKEGRYQLISLSGLCSLGILLSLLMFNIANAQQVINVPMDF
jgi:hypothetical protein